MRRRRAFLALAGASLGLAVGDAKAGEESSHGPRVVAYIRGGTDPRVMWGTGIKSVERVKIGTYRVHFAFPFADTNYSVSVTTQEDGAGNEVSVCEGNEPPNTVRTPGSTNFIFNQLERGYARHTDPTGFSVQVWGV